jgi:hypothetical protein
MISFTCYNIRARCREVGSRLDYIGAVSNILRYYLPFPLVLYLTFPLVLYLTLQYSSLVLLVTRYSVLLSGTNSRTFLQYILCSDLLKSVSFIEAKQHGFGPTKGSCEFPIFTTQSFWTNNHMLAYG